MAPGFGFAPRVCFVPGVCVVSQSEGRNVSWNRAVGPGSEKETRPYEFQPGTEVSRSHVQVNLLTGKWGRTKFFGHCVLE